VPAEGLHEARVSLAADATGDVEVYAAGRVGSGRKAPTSWPARAPRVDSPKGRQKGSG